jgi:membrane-bound inhibitor of C-type lysozyme
MNDYDPTNSDETQPPVTTTERARPPGIRRLLSDRKSGWIVAGVLGCAVIVLAVLLGTSPSATPVPAVVPGGGGSNARSAPAAGGAAGTVDSMSASSFTMTTSAGQEVTVDQASTTTYQNGTSSIPANAITTGQNVLVLGTTNGTTITASQVVVQPTDGGGSAASLAAGVVPFQRGAPATSKQDGQIPPNYSEGSGTIVSGTAANQATEAALAAYPGVVDRVVQLSNGEYEVHYIGVNWPHHIFVDQTFTVMGAD